MRQILFSMLESNPPKRLEIKKYPNRRYYDATHSRHLTLEEIRSMVQQGHDLRIIDARSREDITAQVLTQIILELDSSKLSSFPVPLLARVIRMNDQLVKDFIEKYFNQALQSFMDYQRQVEEQIRQAHGLPPVFPSVSAWTKAVLAPLATAFQPHVEPPDLGEAGEELSALEQKLASLKKDIARMTQRRSRMREGAPRLKRKRK